MVFRCSMDSFTVWKIMFICPHVHFSGALAFISFSEEFFNQKTTLDVPPKFLEKCYSALICLNFSFFKKSVYIFM